MNESDITLQLFIDSWELYRSPVLAGTVAGMLLGMLGVYIVLRRMIFLSAALSQCAGFGVTLAFYGGLHLGFTGLLASPTVGAGLATLTAALVPVLDRRPQRANRESFLGFLYLLGAAGTLIVGTHIVQELHDVHTVLLGSAVAVLDDHLYLILGTALPIFTLHLWWHRGFTQVSFDGEGAQVRHLPVRVLELTLLATLALAISVCTRILGSLPVFAFSILPAMAAVKLVSNVPRALILATIFGGLSGAAGYVVAFLYSWPVGASQALVAGILVLLATAIGALRRG